MISTVTTVTTTCTAVSTVTAAVSFAASIGMLTIMALVVLLIVKELAEAASDSLPVPEKTFQGALNRVLTAGVIPLLIAFALIAAARVMEFLK